MDDVSGGSSTSANQPITTDVGEATEDEDPRLVEVQKRTGIFSVFVFFDNFRCLVTVVQINKVQSQTNELILSFNNRRLSILSYCRCILLVLGDF